MVGDVIGERESMDMMRHSEICYGSVLRSKYGYVVQDDNHRKQLKKAKDYFEGIGIPLCGRVAEFEYINMDVCIERGRKLADRMNHAGRLPAQTAVEVEGQP